MTTEHLTIDVRSNGTVAISHNRQQKFEGEPRAASWYLVGYAMRGSVTNIEIIGEGVEDDSLTLVLSANDPGYGVIAGTTKDAGRHQIATAARIIEGRIS